MEPVSLFKKIPPPNLAFFPKINHWPLVTDYTVFGFRFSVKRINDINKLNSKFVSFENENGITDH